MSLTASASYRMPAPSTSSSACADSLTPSRWTSAAATSSRSSEGCRDGPKAYPLGVSNPCYDDGTMTDHANGNTPPSNPFGGISISIVGDGADAPTVGTDGPSTVRSGEGRVDAK